MQSPTTTALGRTLTLNKYLTCCHNIMKKVKEGTYDMTWRTLVINMGNMSGDSDSICGILCLAYYHFMKNNGLSHIEVNHAIVYHIPLLNLSRSDLESRFESLYILETYGVDTKILLTLDDVDLP